MSLQIIAIEELCICMGCRKDIPANTMHASGNRDFPESRPIPICFHCIDRAQMALLAINTESYHVPDKDMN